MKRYVWCEDSKSGYDFWKCLFGVIYPDIAVETKNSNSKLCIAADQITDDNNIYYIMLDSVMDNPDVVRETRRLKRNISGKNNVRTIKIHSFEYALLSFEILDKWIFAEEDELKEKRSEILEQRDIFVKLIKNGGDASELNEFKTKFNFSQKYNSEKISAKLLKEITRNTGFETDKSQIGQCFINDCCEWSNRQNDDICGLEDRKLTLLEKMEQIVERSVLQAAFKEAGLK